MLSYPEIVGIMKKYGDQRLAALHELLEAAAATDSDKAKVLAGEIRGMKQTLQDLNIQFRREDDE